MALLSSASFVLTQSSGGISPVVVALVVALLIILGLWLVLRLFGRFYSVPSAKASPTVEKRAVLPSAPPAAPAPAKVDNLEIIEGIGPKIAGVLCAAGVTTFAQLAAMEPAKITELLRTGGIRLADPRSWPDQARLAAAGDQAGLKTLQDQLKAGHVVS